MRSPFDVLDTMRSLPLEKRKRLALLLTLIIFALIAGVWFTTLPLRLGKGERMEDDPVFAASVFANLKAEVGDAFGYSRELYHRVKERAIELKNGYTSAEKDAQGDAMRSENTPK